MTGATSERSVAMTRSAALAARRTATRKGQYPRRFSGARDGSVAPNSSSPCGLNTRGARMSGIEVFQRVAEHAGAQAVNDVDVPCPDETRSQPPGTQPEQRIRRAAIENRRPAPVREWERHVRHRPHRELRMAEHCIRAGVSRSVGGRRRCNQRHMNVTRQQASHEIVDVPLEAAEAMKWIDGSRDNGDAQRLSFTRSHCDSGRGAARSS